jgi:phage N-6-adenine-methyltransferase
MPEPAQKRGSSKQDYGTPPELLAAVKRRLCIDGFALDVAASAENAVAPCYYTEQVNGLAQCWVSKGEWTWCNPPYSDITPWVATAVEQSRQGANIAMLLPASVGANWWRDWVNPYAYKVYLNGRLTFVGCEDPYPKDCALLLYTPWGFSGEEVWEWRGSVP